MHLPVECLWTDRLEITTLLGPSSPTGVLEPNAVSDLVLLLGHGLPTTPHILVGPLMAEVVDAYGRHPRFDLGVIGCGSIVGDGGIGLGCGQHLEIMYSDLLGAGSQSQGFVAKASQQEAFKQAKKIVRLWCGVFVDAPSA